MYKDNELPSCQSLTAAGKHHIPLGSTSLESPLRQEMRSELDEKQDMMQVLQETADRLCQENHPAKQTVEVRSPSNSHPSPAGYTRDW